MTLSPNSTRKHMYICIKEKMYEPRRLCKIYYQNTRQIHSTFGRVQVTVRYIVFYYIVILKCMNDFIFFYL